MSALGAEWIAGALTFLGGLVTLFRLRAINEGKRIEREAKHFEHVQEQIRGLKAENDFQHLQMQQLRTEATRAEVERAQLSVKLEIARQDADELTRVEQQLEDEKRRSETFARELADLKRVAAQLGSATVTPLRPPKGGGGGA